MPHNKQTVVTFKVDDALMENLRSIPNRSEFIRAAVLSALDNQCPVCRGTGLLTPAQMTHWRRGCAAQGALSWTAIWSAWKRYIRCRTATCSRCSR